MDKRGSGSGRGTLHELADELMGAAAHSWQGQVRWLLESRVCAAINQDTVEQGVERD